MSTPSTKRQLAILNGLFATVRTLEDKEMLHRRLTLLGDMVPRNPHLLVPHTQPEPEDVDEVAFEMFDLHAAIGGPEESKDEFDYDMLDPSRYTEAEKLSVESAHTARDNNDSHIFCPYCSLNVHSGPQCDPRFCSSFDEGSYPYYCGHCGGVHTPGDDCTPWELMSGL